MTSSRPTARSPLYSHLLSLAQSHATPSSFSEILSIRSPSAIHSWGHNHLVSLYRPTLGEKMDNATFEQHLRTTTPYLDWQGARPSQVHSITIDEWERRAVVHMSYWLKAALPRKGTTSTSTTGSSSSSDSNSKAEESKDEDGTAPTEVKIEAVEQDLIWVLAFTDEDEIDQIKIKESVEFIDAAASSSVGRTIRDIHGGVGEDVRGGITLTGC
ncbi:hypothetical protein CI109_103670 [Kwoniella shandongensis]|uniref:Uncharacterized protein n=1 Tax=Kwoniella shandongensis TaxID=1734106 RepID=A0A5M6C7M2_9TREE|nr:uncharacterized protein CI109_000636 [Kwoniella shandongensis]KAA5531064.1 hypothetical protein CI109_000636 [Kwoniella shandongensis]